MEEKKFKDVFLTPALNAYNKADGKRKTDVISDVDFLEMGIKRVMSYNASGRNFIQTMVDKFNFNKLTTNNFFKALSSERRMKLIKEINRHIVQDYCSLESRNPFKDTHELDEYALYAADGHFHEHPSHERHANGKQYATGHIYATNLRSGTVQHLDVLRPEDKKENEIHALKRLGGNVLRMGEPTGKKVIMVYDRAVIDFREWYNWKYSKGLYVITREKSNMNLTVCGNLEFNRNDSVNAGIVSDQQVGHSHGTMIRKIVYIDPVTDIRYSFITNVMNVSPGLITYIYKIRWDIEKIFQEFKSTYKEKKAWAKSNEAKVTQANFLCIMFNLTLIIENKTEREYGIVDQKVIRKQKKRITKLKEILDKKKAKINPMIITVKKNVMRSLQFTRLIDIAFDCLTSWEAFICKLRPRMEKYL